MPRRLVTSVALLFVGVLVLQSPAQDKDKASSDLPKELIPRTCTLKGEEIPLSRALKELSRQTGNTVEDRRRTRDDPRLNLNLDKVTFWQALDLIAREADARVSPFERDRSVSLVDGPHVAQDVSYSGLFRTTIKRLDAVRQFDTEAHFCTLYLEVAWEPRFQPFLLDPSSGVTATDDKGTKLELGKDRGQGGGPLPVGRRIATEVEMRIPAPPRSVARFGTLSGSINVVGPTKMLVFNFPKLAKIEKKNDIRKDTVEDVTVSLQKFQLEGDSGDQLWTATVLLEYPSNVGSFESFQSWLVNNEAWLEREKDGQKERIPVNGGYETDEANETKAMLRYRFTDEPDKKILLGKPGDWNFVYSTPGRVVELPAKFEFKNVRLP